MAHITTSRRAGSSVKRYGICVDYCKFGTLACGELISAFCCTLSVQPPPPGQKRKKEDWENVWYYGMYGGMALAAVLLYYQPDTRYVSEVIV